MVKGTYRVGGSNNVHALIVKYIVSLLHIHSYKHASVVFMIGLMLRSIIVPIEVMEIEIKTLLHDPPQ